MNKLKTYLPLVLLALPLLLGGGAKLAGVPQLHASFAVLGLPAWFGYFIGAAEVAGAIGLFIPRLQRPAAAGLVPILAGALYFHLRHTPVAEGLPALVLLGLALWLAMRRPHAEAQHR
jgi:putative oxidoreductase